MTNYNDAMANGASMRLVVTQDSQSISGNTSVLDWELWLFCTNGASWTATPQPYNVTIDGVASSGSYTFDFRGSTSKLVASGSRTVSHDSDGTAEIPVSASLSTGVSIGSGAVSGTFYPTTIPRASSSTFGSFTAGSAGTINTNPASGSFTHTLTYSFGSYSGTIGTGVGASDSWTPPMSLLNAIPTSTSGTGTITTKTYSGSTLIGTTSKSFTLYAPSSVVPTIDSISCSEAVAAVASGVGLYVQQRSRFNLGIVGAAGAYGSTIKTHKLTVAGQTINAASGTTGVITSSGTVRITATVTDSRGRSGTATRDVSVLAYIPPTISTSGLSVKRALADGTLNDNGTNLKVAFTGSVQSLMNGTQRNTMRYRISTRAYGATVWTLIQNVARPAGDISETVAATISGYSVSSSWEVLIEVVDLFATSAIISTVATATIFMHWDGSAGLGIGKYHESGALDVAGDIYMSGTRVSVEGHSHSASSITSGVLNVARLPVGEGSGEVAAGNHTHGTNNKVASVIPSGYPTGFSMHSADASYPQSVATVITIRAGALRTVQFCVSKVSGITWVRAEDTDNWGPWTKLAAVDVNAQQAMASGNYTTTATLNAGSGVDVSRTFPTGRFPSAPVVVVTPSNSSRLNFAVVDSSTTSTGFTARLDNFTAAAAAQRSFNWIAVLD